MLLTKKTEHEPNGDLTYLPEDYPNGTLSLRLHMNDDGWKNLIEKINP